jgi:hypothetical protein
VGVPLKYALSCVVAIASALLIWLAKIGLKTKIIVEFERGFAHNYAVVRFQLHEQTELLVFPFQQLSFRQVFFLFICWVIRATEPNTSLHDLRFPLGIVNGDVHTGNIGMGCVGGASPKTRFDMEPRTFVEVAYPFADRYEVFESR